MQFSLDEKQLEMQAEARRFAQERVAPGADARDVTKEFPAGIVKEAAAKGYTAFLAPTTYGGNGLGNVSQAIILEEIAAACASTHVTLSVHNSLMCSPLHRYGSEEQKQRYLPPVCSGEKLGAYLLTEPGSGSDAASMKTTAERQGDEFVINGDKMWITSGDTADLGIVFARTRMEEGVRNTDSITAFIVPMDAEGVSCGKREDKMGLRGSSTVAVYLKDVRVPADAVLGEENRGFHIAMDMLNGGRIGIAIQGIGIARAAMEKAVELLDGLERGGRPVSKSQLVRFRLAEIAARLDGGRLLAYRAAELRDEKKPHIHEASMAKLIGTQAANDACRELVALLGEGGLDRDNGVERLMRDVRVCELYEGTTEVQKLVIAKQVLDRR